MRVLTSSKVMESALNRSANGDLLMTPNTQEFSLGRHAPPAD